MRQPTRFTARYRTQYEEVCFCGKKLVKKKKEKRKKKRKKEKKKKAGLLVARKRPPQDAVETRNGWGACLLCTRTAQEPLLKFRNSAHRQELV